MYHQRRYPGSSSSSEVVQVPPPEESRGYTFENPQNGYCESVDNWAILWSLLFGVFYFAFRGLWLHIAIIVGVTVLFTLTTPGGAGVVVALPLWIGYAIAAPSIIERRYRRNGWREVAGPATKEDHSSEQHYSPKQQALLATLDEIAKKAAMTNAQIATNRARIRAGESPIYPPEALRAAEQQRPIADQPRQASASVADELEKLASLRTRGILTDEEFTQQKAKLLAGHRSAT